MRPLEILIPILLVVWFGSVVMLQQRPRWMNWLPGICLALTLLHMVLEGYRWQMVPLYLLVGICFFFSLRVLRHPASRPPSNRFMRITGNLFGLGVVILASALPVLMPIPRLPKPTGPYSVGTTNLYLVDDTRPELYAPEPGRKRELMVQIWYPVEAGTSGETVPWMQDMEIMGPAMSQEIGMPSFFAGHVVYARTNAMEGATLSAQGAPFPILLFSHGWGGFRQQNTFQMEELASHGYFVVAVQHPYGAVATVFPDGRVAYNNPQALPVGVPEQEFLPAARQLVHQWAGDLGFVLDFLNVQNNLDSGSFFSGRLAVDQVGALGHSTGGGAAVEFCGGDARCKAVLGLDAYLTPVSDIVIQAGLNQPSLFLFSESWPSERNNLLLEQLTANADAPTQAFTILGTDHYDFTDLPMLSPLAPLLGLKGPLNGERVLRIINDYSLAFFDIYLRGKPSKRLGAGSEGYPEVILK